MIRLDKLRLYPFKAKEIAIPNTRGDTAYNIIYLPENTNFHESYYKLKIKKQFVRLISLLPSKIPRLIITGKLFGLLRTLKLIPIREIKPEHGNVYIDTSFFLDALDMRFKKASYRRPIIFNRIMGYLSSSTSSAMNRKNILLYHIDYDKEFPEPIQYRRIFPVLWSIKQSKGNIPYDYFLIAISSGGSTTYSAVKNEESSLPFNRIYSIIISLKPRKEEDLEAIQSAKHEQAAEKIAANVSEGDIDDTRKIKDITTNYLQNSIALKTERIIDRDDLNSEVMHNEAIKSILYHVSGDKEYSERVAAAIPVDKKMHYLKAIKKDLLPEIVDPDKTINKSRDMVYGKIDYKAINGNKEPSVVLNKRKVDFYITFEKDMQSAFASLNQKERFPLKVKKVTRKDPAIIPGDLTPTKYQSYNFVLQDDLGKEHEIDISIPEIQSDGTFLINGRKKYLIYQIILDPIFFIKPGQAKLQTLFATASIHHKHTVHKSYYETYICGYNLPLFVLLGFIMGFKEVCKMYDIGYMITPEKPPKGTPNIVLSDGSYLILSYKTESAFRLINSFLEIPFQFTKENLEDRMSFEQAIIEITQNRNSIYKLSKVLENIMEPVSVQVLKSKLLPYTFVDCVKYICDELANGRVDKRNDLLHQRVRSSEVFAHQIIKTIQASYSEYEAKRNIGDKSAEFKCDTRKVISDIVINSQLVRDLENINPIEELSSMTRITPVGIGGISDTTAVTDKDRSINESYYGNIEPMDTPEGGQIGVINQLTVAATITNARGSFKNKYGSDDKSGVLSPSTVIIPYIGSCDGARVMLACSQTKQALPIKGYEQPLVQSGYETMMTGILTDSYIRKSPTDGVVTKVTSDVIYVKGKDGKNYKTSLDPVKLNSLQGESALNYFHPVIEVGQRVSDGQIMAEGKHIKDGVISIGTNLLVGIMGWKGYSFEDGYIISDRVAEKKLASESYEERVVDIGKTDVVKFISDEGRDTLKGEPLLIRTSKEIEALVGLEEDELVEGQIITKSPGGKIIAIEVYANTSLRSFPALKKQYEIFKKRYEDTIGEYPAKFFEMRSGSQDMLEGIRIIFKIERTEVTILGDKLANSHGGKGVITLIEKEENMPLTPWGQRLDLILNPIAIINRMNPSTIYEMYTGLIAKFLATKIVELDKNKAMKLISDVYSNLDQTKGHLVTKQILSAISVMSDSAFERYKQKIILDDYVLPIIIPPFQSPNKDHIRAALGVVGAESSYYLKLPEYGGKTKRKVSCGYLYYKKLEAQSDKKLAARSTGRYQGRILQPVAGRKAGGGQRVGEFDSWAIIDHGCTNILKELFGPLSDDQKTKDELVSEIIETGETKYREPSATPTKDLLDVYLRGMMLETSIHTQRNK